MGKKRYQEKDVSKPLTEALGIADLLALRTSTENHYYTVHERYFTDVKLPCPACGSAKTRCSKVVQRTFKDILWDVHPAKADEKRKFQVVDLTFYQRYLRCDKCNNSVFPEPIDFGDKGCRYTNRLSDALADGSFRFSYKKVCDYFGVPASTASIGPIMRRRILYRESLLPPVSTPKKLGIKQEISDYIEAEEKPSDFYPTALQAVCEAFKRMPHCIFDVLRARCFLTISHDTIEEDGTKCRLGISTSRLTQNMNKITANIKGAREYGL